LPFAENASACIIQRPGYARHTRRVGFRLGGGFAGLLTQENEGLRTADLTLDPKGEAIYSGQVNSRIGFAEA
jgi:hypothetical protein